MGEVMHCTMKQMAVLKGHARPIFARSTEFWNIHDRLGPGLRDDITV